METNSINQTLLEDIWQKIPPEEKKQVASQAQSTAISAIVVLIMFGWAMAIGMRERERLTSQLAEREQAAALGRLAATIAHEVRNPVGAMSHAAQLLAESPDRQVEDSRLIEIIRGNATRISEIVENVMQLSVGREVHAERMPLREWLENFLAEGLGGGELPEGRIGLEQPEDDLEIRADPSQLRQVLRNLVENACHFGLDTPDKRVELRSGRMVGSGRPFVEVLDRGPGVPEEQRERVFEPFFTTRQGGTGLGLFISRELAQGIGAMMTYEPRPGGGSIFRIVFADPTRWE
jgi:two-component system sensor histidine kinase PilS (NtrC family)